MTGRVNVRELRRLAEMETAKYWTPAHLRDEVLALLDVAEAARQRRCNRFDRIPCSERPEIPESEWCAMCAALARFDFGDDDE